MLWASHHEVYDTQTDNANNMMMQTLYGRDLTVYVYMVTDEMVLRE